MILSNAIRGLTQKSSILIISISCFALINTAFVTALLTESATVRSFGTIAHITPLHIEGRYIKDEFGNIVTLRGVNKHGFEDDPGGRWKDETGTSFYWVESRVRRNLEVMRNWGVNEIRVFERVRYWKENTLDASSNMYHRDIIKRLITLAGEYGIYVTFALFSMDSGTGHHGVPWGTTQIPTMQDFVNLWINIATELKDYPNVLFELWNEVARDQSLWFDGVNATIKAIRAITNHIIIVQWDWDVWYREGQYAGVLTLDWVNDPRIQGTNILFSTHMYRDARGFYQYEDGTVSLFYTYEDIKKAFVAEKVQTHLETWNKPLYVGEYGPTKTGAETYLPNELTGCDGGLTIFEEWGISYSLRYWWIGSDTGGFGMFKEVSNRIYYDDPSYITEWGNIAKAHLLAFD